MPGERKARNKNLTVPNALSVLRILVVPFFAWRFLAGDLYTAAGLLVLSGLLSPDGSFKLSILKAGSEDGAPCLRYFYEYEAAQPGAGRFISTYEGFGSPLPSFQGEPVEAGVPELDAAALAGRLWAALNEDNRVSLYVSVGGEEVIINKWEESK